MKDIFLVGKPNSGKTSLFNRLTGMNQKVGNFAGVTVDITTGSRALQVINGEAIITAIRSLGSSSILVLIIAGIEQAQLDINGIALFPLKPKRLRKLSEI